MLMMSGCETLVSDYELFFWVFDLAQSRQDRQEILSHKTFASLGLCARIEKKFLILKSFAFGILYTFQDRKQAVLVRESVKKKRF